MILGNVCTRHCGFCAVTTGNPGGARDETEPDRIAEAVRELVRFTSMDHRQVNSELNRLAGIRKVTEATIEQLQRRLDVANKWIKRI